MSRFIRPTHNIVRRVSTDLLFKPKQLSLQESLLNIPQTNISVLDNGLKVATNNNMKPFATIGVFIKSGARYEKPEINGSANLLERLAYKGTKSRSQLEFEKEVGNCGIRLKSYTTRDTTAFFAQCLNEHVPKAVELLSDIIQHSANKAQDIDKERKLILHELENEVDKHEKTFDYLHAAAFQTKSLEQAVAGSSYNIENLTEEDLELYRQAHFKPGRMVLAGVGGVKHDDLVQLTNQHFTALPENMEGTTPHPGDVRFTGSELIERNDDDHLAHCAFALSSVGYNDPDLLPLKLASVLVGSWDRTFSGIENHPSKFAQLIAKNNYCHAYKSFNISYEDTGLWGVYYVCDRMNIYDFTWYVTEELNRLCTSVSDFEIDRAKNVFRTNMMAEIASNDGNCEFIGKQVLRNGKMPGFEDFEFRLESVDASRMKKVLMKHIYDMEVASVGIGPTEQVLDINVLRSWMYSIFV